MKIINSSNLEGIPYASVVVNDENGGQIYGVAADEFGNVDFISLLPFLVFKNNVTVSAAGYTSITTSGLSLATSNEVALQPSILPDFVFTAIRKAKQNPLAALLIIGIIVALIAYRKQIFK